MQSARAFANRGALLLSIFCVCAMPCAARDVYVNNVTGDDRAGGESADAAASSRPVRTIERALRLVNRGGRIILASTGEPYREMISLSDREHRGYPGQPLVIVGNGAVLDGTVAAAPGAWRHERENTFSMRPRRLTYQQLFRDGAPLRRVRSESGGAEGLALEPLTWALHDGRIFLGVEAGRLPEQYSLRHCGLQTGITLYNTEHVRIEDLVIQGFQQDGVNAHELVRHCELVRVESRANGRSGISVGGVSRVDLRECGGYDNGEVQLRVEGLANVSAERSDFDREGETVPWVAVFGQGRATIDGVEYRPNARR